MSAAVTLLVLITIAFLPTGSYALCAGQPSITNPRDCMGTAPIVHPENSGVQIPGQDTLSNSVCFQNVAANRLRFYCYATNVLECREFYVNGVLTQPLPGVVDHIRIPAGGEYACVLVNNCGRTRFPVLIPSVAPILETEPTQTGVIPIGTPVACLGSSSSGIQPGRLSCNVTNPEVSSAFNITWSRNDQALPSFFNMAEIEVTTPGRYSCTVRNLCGSTSNSTVIRVTPSIFKGNGTNSSAMIDVGTDSCIGSGNLMIFCNIVGDVPATRIWFKNNVLLTGVTNNKITVTPSANQDDMYTCNVTNECGTDAATTTVIRQTEVNIMAMITTTPPVGTGCSRVMGDLRFSMADLCPLVGETVIISCSVTGGVSYFITAPSGTSVSQQNLVINNFQSSDSGVYTCTATSRCGVTMDRINITNIDLPPNITDFSNDVCLLSGQTTNLTCSASGLVVRYVWTRDNVVISSMQNLTGVSYGTYTCIAVGVGANDTATLRILPNVTSTLTVSSNQGSRCPRLRVQPPPAGIDFCAYSRDTVMLQCTTSFPGVPAQIFPDGQSSMRVFNLIQVADGRTYSCSGMNECGTFNDTKNIGVYRIPRITTEKEIPPPQEGELVGVVGQTTDPICGRDGQKVTLHCCYDGTNPTVQWYYVFPNNTEVLVNASDASIMIMDTGSNLILMLNPFEERLSGKYRCNITNIAGTTAGNIDVTYKPPEDKEWAKGRWSACSPDCHRGIRNRTVLCVTVTSRMVMNDTGCPTPKPPTQERCLDRGACSRWVPGPWSACSRTCGAGFRFRNVTCRTTYSNAVLSDSECTSPGPRVFERCNIQACACTEPAFCSHIKGSELCWNPRYIQMCCCTCGSPNTG